MKIKTFIAILFLSSTALANGNQHDVPCTSVDPVIEDKAGSVKNTIDYIFYEKESAGAIKSDSNRGGSIDAGDGED